MPGPVSAPNGDKSLVVDIVKRNDLAAKNKLVTGKTGRSNNNK
jgi:hypothetical protein